MQINLDHIEDFLGFRQETPASRSIPEEIAGLKTPSFPKDSLFISGGATRFIGLGAAAIKIWELGYRPEILGGISAGAILTLPLITGKHPEIIQYGLKATRKNIFKIPPTTAKGSISWQAIFRTIFGHYSFGIQDVKPMIREVITPYDFDKFQAECKHRVYIMAVNANTGGRKLWEINKKEIGYEDYLQIISASSRIPIMTQAEYVDGQPYFDGGLRNHIPTTKVISTNPQVGRTIEIYARPKNFKVYDERWCDNIVKIIWRTIKIMSMEISKRDEKTINLMAFIRKTPLKQLFLPEILESQYDTDPANLMKLKKAAEKMVVDSIDGFI